MAGERGPGPRGPMRTAYLSEEEKENQPKVTAALLKRIPVYYCDALSHPAWLAWFGDLKL